MKRFLCITSPLVSVGVLIMAAALHAQAVSAAEPVPGWYFVQAADTAPAFTPAASDHMPPRFLPGVAIYDADNMFLSLEVGTTFSYSCHDALEDTKTTIARAVARGRRLVGLCIPVPTYSVKDLLPAKDAPKDNEI